MPLLSSILRSELSKLCVQNNPQFLGFGGNNLEVGQKWSRAIKTYAVGCIIPSTTHQQAEIACKNTFLGLTNTPSNGLLIMQQAFSAYASIMSQGTQPVFTSTPPLVPINLIPVFSLGLSGASSQMCVDMMTNVIHAWFLTGFSVNNQSGITTNWS